MNKLLEKIESDKEILSAMPKNNKKNIAKYVQTIKDLKEEYKSAQIEVWDEMQKRYNKIISVKENKKIEIQKSEMQELENLLEIIDTTKTSYEKMGLDKRIYKLGKFYKENLESINTEILACINKFKEVGVELTQEDFNYSIYVNEYMGVFFKEITNENINSDEVKEKFEEIYWKCPDLIIHIELNFRYLYALNKKAVDKYYDKRKEELLKNINVEQNKIQEKYENLKRNLDEDINTDKYLITNAFLNGDLNVKDYEEDKIKQEYAKMVPEKLIKNASKKSKKEISQNCIKFLDSLYEYKNYLKYEFILKDIKEKYNEREQHKNSYNSIKKEISSKEKKLKALNNKMTGKGLFGKKDKKENQTVQYNDMVLEIKELYKQMDNEEIYSKIIDKLSETSTIYDALSLASQFNNYLVGCIIKENPNIAQEEIEETIEEFKNFLNNPYSIITKNITILEEKNIPVIISDRYKLLNFSISKEDINEENLDSLIATLQKIKNYYNIQKSGVDLKDMEFISEFKKLI